MPDVITLCTLVACTAICGRLLTYRRLPGTRHRAGIGLCAWLLIASTGGQALQIMVTGAHAASNPWQLGVLSVLVALSFRARGNVAHMLKVD